MLQSEPTAELRALSALLYNTDGTPLAAATSWLAGMVKISKANGAFVNSTNTPTAVTGGATNAFKLQLTIAEVNTVGALRVQFFASVGGDLLAEYIDEVNTGTFDVTTIAAAVDELPVLGAHTRGDLDRLVVAVLAGPVLDFTTGTLVYKCPVTGVTRLTVTKNSTGRLVSTIGDLATS
ncbi:MAG: hypothetical protein M3R55_12150 [Acidobacteriota bacterium]|nr:hypothetical protein [Acidobacteriota bacterium]